MATPADVIAGEVIESEWGNTIRDFACFGVTFAATFDSASDGSLSSTYENGASISFVPDSDWVGFKLLAWGSCMFGHAALPQQRILIGASTGTESPVASGVPSPMVNHSVSGLSGTQSVVIQYRSSVAGASKYGSWLNLIAIRTS